MCGTERPPDQVRYGLCPGDVVGFHVPGLRPGAAAAWISWWITMRRIWSRAAAVSTIEAWPGGCPSLSHRCSCSGSRDLPLSPGATSARCAFGVCDGPEEEEVGGELALRVSCFCFWVVTEAVGASGPVRCGRVGWPGQGAEHGRAVFSVGSRWRSESSRARPVRSRSMVALVVALMVLVVAVPRVGSSPASADDGACVAGTSSVVVCADGAAADVQTRCTSTSATTVIPGSPWPPTRPRPAPSRALSWGNPPQ